MPREEASGTFQDGLLVM